MSSLPRLNFPAIRLRARERAGATEVWCETRRAWLVLTPEEWVRRHLVDYLANRCGAPLGRIVEEYAVRLNGQTQRADVVVVGDDARPLLVAECKAPGVGIDRQALAQAVRYNSVVGARYVALTDGMRHYCYELCDGAYRPLEGFPQLG